MLNSTTFISLGDESCQPRLKLRLVKKLINMISGIEKYVNYNQLILQIVNK